MSIRISFQFSISEGPEWRWAPAFTLSLRPLEASVILFDCERLPFYESLLFGRSRPQSMGQLFPVREALFLRLISQANKSPDHLCVGPRHRKSYNAPNLIQLGANACILASRRWDLEMMHIMRISRTWRVIPNDSQSGSFSQLEE